LSETQSTCSTEKVLVLLCTEIRGSELTGCVGPQVVKSRLTVGVNETLGMIILTTCVCVLLTEALKSPTLLTR
jgi:hypothetical protein